MNSILVTGGAGFIGSHLCKYLLEKGYDVSAIDNLSTGSINNIEDLICNQHFKFIYEDLNDFKNTDSIKFDCIFHLASTVGVDLVMSNPIGTIKNNINSSIKATELASVDNIPLIMFSSSEIYGQTDIIPQQEDNSYMIGSPDNPRWTYSISKIAEEFLSYSYFMQSKKCTVVRLFNVIGINQSSSYGMVVPRFIDSALINEPLTVYFDGLQTRSFCDIDDIIDALYIIMVNPSDDFRILNIGNHSEISILKLAELIIKLTASNSEIRFVSDNVLSNDYINIKRRVPDITRAKEQLKWMPNISIENSLIKIINHRKEKKSC